MLWPRLQLGSVARNMAVVGGASVLGQVANVLAAPLLAHLYDPEAFGLLSVYAAVLSVLVAIASLRFDFAIPIAADPLEALHLLALSVLLAFVTSMALGLVLLAWGAQLSAALGAAPLAPFLWLLPVALFTASVAQALASWAVYTRSFPALGRMRAMNGLAQAGGQAALGVIHAGPLGLLLGDLAGDAFGMEQLSRRFVAVLRSTRLSLATLGRCAHERWGFARVMTAASFLTALSLQVPFLLIPKFFGLQLSGQYFLAYRVLVLPGSLVAAAVSQVFFGEASFRRADPQRLHDLAYNAAVCLFVFSIPTYAIVMVGGPALIEAVFGYRWALAGHYAQIMAPWLMLWSVASPISTLVLVGRREIESLAYTAAEFVLEAASLVIGAQLHSLMVGIAILSTVSLLINVAALWRFLRVVPVSLLELVRPVGQIVALTITCLTLVVLIGIVAPGFVPAAAVMAWAIAFVLAMRFSPEVRALLSGTQD